MYHDVRVADDSALKDFEELLSGDGLKDLAGILESELGGGFKGGDTILIGLVLLCGGGNKRRKRLPYQLEKKGFQIYTTLTLEEDECRKKGLLAFRKHTGDENSP
ncbi:hypothetical protein MRB53_026368 [Persea americana]|uniref:Uncharacterized protein n=1 Tax=Persea americana TaxID=3435 RepID=A0ACC2LIX7_PERAE|nr:hypothetical protein MRB53_026368 [Persea americana]